MPNILYSIKSKLNIYLFSVYYMGNEIIWRFYLIILIVVIMK